MDKKRAKKVLAMLDKINDEIVILGNIIIKSKLKPVPVPIKTKDRFRIR